MSEGQIIRFSDLKINDIFSFWRTSPPCVKTSETTYIYLDNSTASVRSGMIYVSLEKNLAYDPPVYNVNRPIKFEETR